MEGQKPIVKFFTIGRLYHRRRDTIWLYTIQLYTIELTPVRYGHPVENLWITWGALHIYRQILFLKFRQILFFKFIYFLFFTFPKFSLQPPPPLPTLQANNKLSFSAPYQTKFDKNKNLYYNKENKKFIW